MESETRKKPGPKPKPVPIEKNCIKCAETKPSSEFPVGRNACKVCVSKQQHEYYTMHKDVRKLNVDPEKKRQACRRWYAKPSTVEHLKAYRKRKHEANKEASNAKSREYKQKNKARLNFNHHKQRAKKHGVLATVTYEDWRALCDQYQNRCLCCGEQKPLVVDHVIAMVLGGSHTLDNLQPLCKECHVKKHVRMTDYRPPVP
jgi:5-methylcytosine-specific restriction endonuclease McrA